MLLTDAHRLRARLLRHSRRITLYTILQLVLDDPRDLWRRETPGTLSGLVNP